MYVNQLSLKLVQSFSALKVIHVRVEANYEEETHSSCFWLARRHHA
jgi:hypothetical protein